MRQEREIYCGRIGAKVENERDCSSGNLGEWLSKLRFSCANLMEV